MGHCECCDKEFADEQLAGVDMCEHRICEGCTVSYPADPADSMMAGPSCCKSCYQNRL